MKPQQNQIFLQSKSKFLHLLLCMLKFFINLGIASLITLEDEWGWVFAE
jgi:hypothetical protein